MKPLDLKPEWIVRDGAKVIAARVHAEKSLRGAAAARSRRRANDPLMREAQVTVDHG